MLNALQILGRQRWLRRGLRARIIKRFAPPEAQAGAFEVPFFGYRYRGRVDSYIDWHVYYFGAYEHEVLLLMRDILRARDHPVFLDVGANVGHHTLFAARHAAKVHAFEPFPLVRAGLLQKLADNALDNVVVHAFGLGDVTVTLPFFAPSGANQGTGSFVPDHAHTNQPSASLPLVKGDEFANASLSRVDLIKIDVEGFEPQVLRGLEQTLARHRPAVLFEYSETTRRAVPSIEALLGHFPVEYELFRLDTRKVVLRFFEFPSYRLVPAQSIPLAAGEMIALPRNAIPRSKTDGFFPRT